jgi:lipoic acid synthetase
MLGGDICTRHCGFCAVGKGQPGALDPEEPRHVAEAVNHLNLAHAVITSVNRDDLPDGGAAHWAQTIREVRALNPDCKIEVLIPDFNGDEAALNTVLDAEPDVLNHNTETIARLYRRVRPDAVYQQSLTLLQRAAVRRDRENRGMLTKSGIMVGLGETFDEVVELMYDLRIVSCDIMTIGQYLQPHARRLPVERYVTPEEFAKWREIGMSLGFSSRRIKPAHALLVSRPRASREMKAAISDSTAGRTCSSTRTCPSRGFGERSAGRGESVCAEPSRHFCSQWHAGIEIRAAHSGL